MGKDGLLRKRGSEDRRGTFRESAFTTPEFNSAHKVLSYFYCVGTLRTVVHALTSTDQLFSRYSAQGRRVGVRIEMKIHSLYNFMFFIGLSYPSIRCSMKTQ